jgi:hypothetical protein
MTADNLIFLPIIAQAQPSHNAWTRPLGRVVDTDAL